MMDKIIPKEKTIEERYIISGLDSIKNELVKNKSIGIAKMSEIRFTVTRYQKILFFSINPPYSNL